MNAEGYPAGTTEYDRRERQEFAGIRAFAPLGDSDPAWESLREAAKQLETEVKNEDRLRQATN